MAGASDGERSCTQPAARHDQARRRHRVARLHAFGSVLRPDDLPGESDIDLLVEFQPDAPEVLYKT
jgi:predicted nucleotidyltransferase